jgi:hypothetical protein
MFERTVVEHFHSTYPAFGLQFCTDNGMGSTVVRERKAIRVMATLEWDGDVPLTELDIYGA